MRPSAAALTILLTVLACARGLPPVATPPEPPAKPPSAGPASAGEPAGRALGEDAGATAVPPEDSAAAAGGAIPTPVARMQIPSRIRVGLVTDLERLRIPAASESLTLANRSRWIRIEASTLVEPRGNVRGEVVYRLQAAALKAETQAEALARRLTQMVAGPSEIVFDARDGLYRVRLGRYATRAEAEDGARRLRQHGVDDAWVVSEQAQLEDPGFEVTQGKRQWVFHGRWLRIAVARTSTSGIALHGRRYRGDLLLYLNDRGRLNLINRLSLDDYLRGVVPREMGPEIYAELEALKAQAVAARTYTLRNLGEFRAEGYDICATPRCQVYGGIDSEHPLSDRAIRDTEGQVLVADGWFADTLYSSTCGGHTENVEVVFPSKQHAYLRGVPCLEAGAASLAGAAAPRGLLETAVLDRLLPGSGGDGVSGFVDRARRLAAMAGLEPEVQPPSSLDRREVQGFVARLLALEPSASLEVAPAALPAGWSAEEVRLAHRLSDAGLMEEGFSPALGRAERQRVLYRLAVYLRLMEQVDGRFLRLAGGRLETKSQGITQAWRLDGEVVTFRPGADGALRPGDLHLVAGDSVSVYAAGERVLALAQSAPGEEVEPSPTSQSRGWRYVRSDRELASLVNSRYPGLGFQRLEVLARGVSGRAARLRLTGAAGEEVEVVGLPIRWLLDLPDTLFTVKQTVLNTGEPAWVFAGRGWGHGVGMCQVGSYGMSRRGLRYREILEHYYTGLELREIAAGDSPDRAAS